MSIPTRVIVLGAAVVASLAAAAGTWLHGAATARAPEPAQLTQSLSGIMGSTAAAMYVNTRSTTTVVKWPSAYSSSAYPPPAGQPCSTGDLAAGASTGKLIQASGNYRRCV
jgi:hypothetical protein